MRNTFASGPVHLHSYECITVSENNTYPYYLWCTDIFYPTLIFLSFFSFFSLSFSFIPGSLKNTVIKGSCDKNYIKYWAECPMHSNCWRLNSLFQSTPLSLSLWKIRLQKDITPLVKILHWFPMPFWVKSPNSFLVKQGPSHSLFVYLSCFSSLLHTIPFL